MELKHDELEDEANQKAGEYLNNSPYKDKLGNEVFLKPLTSVRRNCRSFSGRMWQHRSSTAKLRVWQT